MTDQQQQLCQSSERLLKLFLDESVTNKSISLQLWFNRAGKLQFQISTTSSRRENRRTTASTDEEPVSAANRPLLRAPTRPQPTITTRSISAANNKKRKTVPTSSPTPVEPSPELPRCASQQNQHELSFLDTNRKDRQSSEDESSDEEAIPEIAENESVYTSPFFNKNRFQALSSPPTSKINAPDSHQPVVTSVPEGHVYVAPTICDICIKPHKRLAYTYIKSSNSRVEYWDDQEAFIPYKCLCYAQNECNCVHSERRNEILQPKPDDV